MREVSFGLFLMGAPPVVRDSPGGKEQAAGKCARALPRWWGVGSTVASERRDAPKAMEAKTSRYKQIPMQCPAY